MELSNISTPKIDAAKGMDTHQRTELAKKLEATFISEMLKSSGFDAKTDGFGGGIGEEQFQSFLRERQSELIVEKGGVGLAAHFANSIKAYGK